jgi:DNA-binding NarL/FixJ family response regulator
MTIRVMLVDDQELVRAGFRVLLESAPDIEIVGEASDGAEAVQLAEDVDADVILMDIRMTGMDGIEATRAIVDAHPCERPRVLVLTTFGTDEYVYEALRAGASGFLLKDAGPARLFDAVRVIAGGDALLDPAVTRRLIAEFAARPGGELVHPGALDALTDREREVLVLVAEGLSNEEITERLYISMSTAKKHVSNAMMKLGARDRAQLVVIAYRSGLVGTGTKR